MNGFKPYPAYKDSGDEWLSEVPEHWDVLPLKHFAEVDNSGCYGVEPADGVHIRPVATTAQIDSEGRFDVGRMSNRGFSAQELARYECSPGDVLVVKSSGSAENIISGKAGLVRIDTPPFVFSNFLMRLRYRKDICLPSFLYSLLISHLTRERIKQMCSTTTYPNLQVGLYTSAKLPCPPLNEQTQIARFLDHETARIDALIEEQQRLIELLKEKRQAVISHAVTKGLDPTVPMKDSGVEWLGEVPAHWGTNALNKLTVKITNGYVGPTRDILVESGVPYVQATHIKRGVVNFDDAYFVTPEWSMKMSKSILQEGDVLIVQTGAGTGDVGVVSSREAGYNCHALIILQTDKSVLSGVFLGQVLQSHFGQSVLYSIRTGGMHPHLNCGEVKFVKIPVPPLREQEEISNFVKTFSEQAEKLIIEAGTTMDLLQERRSALISAAVTGKIDVRGWQPPASASQQQSEALEA